jgi:hypothetical protein
VSKVCSFRYNCPHFFTKSCMGLCQKKYKNIKKSVTKTKKDRQYNWKIKRNQLKFDFNSMKQMYGTWVLLEMNILVRLDAMLLTYLYFPYCISLIYFSVTKIRMFLYAQIYWLAEFGDVSCLQFNYLRVETLTLTLTKSIEV